MSALHLPRLVFSGDFQADVSTVNNDVRHYDTATFEPRFQQPASGATRNGWWNPSGSGAFRLIGCAVRSVASRRPASPGDEDPVATCSVSGSSSSVSGKLVDLDPQWQMASEIWGLTIRLADARGGTVLEGTFEPAPFRDIHFGRQSPATPNGQAASAVYTSRLTAVRSHLPPGRSPFLDDLLAASDDGTLAVRLTTFGYSTNPRDPRFTLGRVVGALGPARRGEPHRFVLGRRLAPAANGVTAANLTFADAVVDPEAGLVSLDLGNALPITDPVGTTAAIGPLALAVLRTPDRPDGAPGVREGDVVPLGDLLVLGRIDHSSPGWLSRTAGIVDLALDEPAAALAADRPLALVRPVGNEAQVLLRETAGGLLARADDVVLRVDARSDGAVAATVRFCAARWGRPLTAATIRTRLEPRMSGLGGGPRDDPDPPAAPIPDIGVPQEAVELPPSLATDDDGRAELPLTVHDPGRPRGYLDGQVYVIAYSLDGQAREQQHRFDVVVLHVREAYAAPALPTWVDDVRPVLVQYGDLYPIMSRRLVDLGDYDAVREHAAIIDLAFSRPLDDPNHMPVTRELSDARREMLLTWLRDRNGYGERRLRHGPRPSAAAPAAPAPRAASDSAAAPPDDGRGAGDVDEIGGKAVALPQALEQLLRAAGRDD
ncbi:hypothetical protein SAMN05660350_03456 [Geodermatophilus obscurus]|uniref:Uncharacterized protein n=1 Tax=Geodermatophilus obscurus TaxID=1861 RepID=A0A1M7UL08_9ACTN|nr:hypothetical protein [Geodermatophilus obscurus]SHN83638.1 hypothetical protein SAMN05660350_03456 [Geodermatophilus obscurus]